MNLFFISTDNFAAFLFNSFKHKKNACCLQVRYVNRRYSVSKIKYEKIFAA